MSEKLTAAQQCDLALDMFRHGLDTFEIAKQFEVREHVVVEMIRAARARLREAERMRG